MSDVFISYASQDRDKAQQFARVLEDHGWSVWWDRDIPTGRAYDDVIEQAIDEAHCVIVLWTEQSVASTWVRTEADVGAEKNTLIPVMLEDVRLPMAFRRYQAADLRDWDGLVTHAGMQKLLADIEKILGPTSIKEQQPSEAEAIPSQPDSNVRQGTAQVQRTSTEHATKQQDTSDKGQDKHESNRFRPPLKYGMILGVIIAIGLGGYWLFTPRTVTMLPTADEAITEDPKPVVEPDKLKRVDQRPVITAKPARSVRVEPLAIKAPAIAENGETVPQ